MGQMAIYTGNAELPTFFSQKLHFPPWFHRWPGSPSPVGLPGSAQFSRKTRQRLVSSVGTSTKKSPSQRRRQPAPRRCVRISARGLGEIPLARLLDLTHTKMVAPCRRAAQSGRRAAVDSQPLQPKRHWCAPTSHYDRRPVHFGRRRARAPPRRHFPHLQSPPRL